MSANAPQPEHDLAHPSTEVTPLRADQGSAQRSAGDQRPAWRIEVHREINLSFAQIVTFVGVVAAVGLSFVALISYINRPIVYAGNASPAPPSIGRSGGWTTSAGTPWTPHEIVGADGSVYRAMPDGDPAHGSTSDIVGPDGQRYERVEKASAK